MSVSESVAVLLSVYNGGRHLNQLLESVICQNYKPLVVLARDDGSSDKSGLILNEYTVSQLESSSNVGAKNSFLELLRHALATTDIEYFMFCDQDDVWLPDKISRTLLQMQSLENKYGGLPFLVHTDLQVVDEHLNVVAHSMWDYEFCYPEKNSLNRILMQNTVTGCTVMVNRRLAEMCVDVPSDAIMHDWWLALIASCFGRIGYIKEATILYRQHDTNSIGAKAFKTQFIRRMPGALKKIFVHDDQYLNSLEVNINQARAFLEIFEPFLSEYDKKMLYAFVSLERQSFWRRRITLIRFRLFRQGWLRNMALLLRI